MSSLESAIAVIPTDMFLRAIRLGCGTASSTLCRRVAPLAPSRLCCRARSSISVGHPELGHAAGASTSAVTAAVASAAVPEVASRAVGWWLIGTSASVFAMVVVGGITRLTRSGLSMTDWRPQNKPWPRDATAWEAEFARYKEFPEYQRLYAGSGFDLDDFKNIFFWEWAHRTFGRTIGFIFGVPLAVFALRGQIPRKLAPTLGLLFVMGGSQGLVGWWMVRSGLEKQRIDEIAGGIPRVSPYRLATHLSCAFAIFSLLLYTGLGVLQPRAEHAMAALQTLQTRVRLLALLVGVTAVSGAFVAGMQAGHTFNTFPLMEGRLVPDGYMELTPLYRNFFESVPSVQLVCPAPPARSTCSLHLLAPPARAACSLTDATDATSTPYSQHHRILALTTLSSVTALWLSVQRMPLPMQLRIGTDVLLLAAWGQVSLGIATLVNCVPVHLGSAHQAGALTLFSVLLFTLHSCRVPHAGRLLARIASATPRAPAPAAH